MNMPPAELALEMVGMFALGAVAGMGLAMCLLFFRARKGEHHDLR